MGVEFCPTADSGPVLASPHSKETTLVRLLRAEWLDQQEMWLRPRIQGAHLPEA